MQTDERQVAANLDEIRRDHVARYEWVTAQLDGQKRILDAACGVGYGSHIMASAGHSVTGFDISREAVEYAADNWAHQSAQYAEADLSHPIDFPAADVAVAFECVEHIEDPRPMLKSLRQSASVLFASVPNEDVFPWRQGNKVMAHHYRHYTRGQFRALLAECGWHVVEWFGQESWDSEVEPNVNGRTIIAKCERCEPVALSPMRAAFESSATPEHVAIVALGPSLSGYTNVAKSLGGRHRYCDEVWAVNALGAVVQCDRIFHMDDVRIQEIRAAEQPDSNIAAMLKWMQTTDIPIITSRAHPDYPATREFPLQDVLNRFDAAYFNSTVAYAVAYAVYIGVKKLSLFGVDFTYPNAHDAEKGRACVEFWMGIATAQGIKLVVPTNTTLLDAIHTDRERFYGYDTVDMLIDQDETGFISVDFTEREDLPTAAEIEHAYSHDRHPNPLMVEVK